MARVKEWLKVWFPDEVEKLKHEENGLILEILDSIDEILLFSFERRHECCEFLLCCQMWRTLSHP